jgi:hypothetical protein
MARGARLIALAALVLLALGGTAGCGGLALDREGRTDGSFTDLGEGVNPQWTAEGRIIFRDGPAVWEMDPDGGNMRRVLELETDAGLRLSPDRRSMLLLSIPTNWIAGIDGSGLRPIADVPASSTAVWSDDGSMISFQRTEGGQDSIWAVRSEGGETRRIFPDFGGFVLAWSKDGRMVVNASRQGAGGSLPGTILVLPGYTLEKLPMLLEEARFLPDGSVEAVVAQGGGLAVLDAEGRLSRRIDAPTDTRELPGRSPDGTLLAFSGDDGVWLTDAHGGGARRVTDKHCHGPEFSPDGRTLLCRYVKFVGIDDEGGEAMRLHVGVIDVPLRS